MGCVRIVMVHGFNVRQPELSLELLAPLFTTAGFRVHPFHYGWTDLVDACKDSDNYADSLLSLCDAVSGPAETIIPIGHSNGCNVINIAAHLASARAFPPFRRAIYLSPALDCDTTLADAIDRIDVCHTRSDMAVRFARWLPWNPWGDMGARGYVGTDERYRNLDGYPTVKAHSDWMTEPGRAWVAEHVVKPLAEELKCAPSS